MAQPGTKKRSWVYQEPPETRARQIFYNTTQETVLAILSSGSGVQQVAQRFGITEEEARRIYHEEGFVSDLRFFTVYAFTESIMEGIDPINGYATSVYFVKLQEDGTSIISDSIISFKNMLTSRVWVKVYSKNTFETVNKFVRETVQKFGFKVVNIQEYDGNITWGWKAPKNNPDLHRLGIRMLVRLILSDGYRMVPEEMLYPRRTLVVDSCIVCETSLPKMFQCGTCMSDSVLYCSRQCQREDWEHHKETQCL